MEVYLETERLILRRFSESDVDAIVELDSDPEVMRYLTGGQPTPREVIRDEVLPRLIADYGRYPGYGRWPAIERATGQFLGWFALRHANRRSAELGYRLRRSAWGKGYATEGSRALLHKAFTELGTDRVYATTMTVNVASRRVMEKVGLTFVRTFFEEWPEYIAGAEYGDVEYAVDRAAWSRSRGDGIAQP